MVVGRSLEAIGKKVIIAVVCEELTVKRLSLRGDRVFLEAENEAYAPLEITEDMDFEVWGVVTCVVHPL